MDELSWYWFISLSLQESRSSSYVNYYNANPNLSVFNPTTDEDSSCANQGTDINNKISKVLILSDLSSNDETTCCKLYFIDGEPRQGTIMKNMILHNASGSVTSPVKRIFSDPIVFDDYIVDMTSPVQAESSSGKIHTHITMLYQQLQIMTCN